MVSESESSDEDEDEAINVDFTDQSLSKQATNT